MSQGLGVVGAGAAVVLVALLVAVAVLLSQAQSQAQRSAERRFSERAQISAALTQSVFRALGASSGQDLEGRYGGARSDVARSLARELPVSHLSYSAVVDARGGTLAGVGRLPGSLALAGAARGGLLLSDVVHAGGAPVIEYAIPFGSRGTRRALVEGVPLGIVASFLTDYLARLRGGAGLALTDRNGAVLIRQGRISPAGTTSSKRFGTAAAVPGTPWTLRLEADRAIVLAGVNHLRWLPWLLLLGLALAAVTGVRFYVRMLTSVSRQRQANVALHESREQITNIVQALEQGVILHHADGRTELLNASAKELFDTDADTLDGMAPGWELLDDAGAPLAEGITPIQRVLGSGSAQRGVIGLERRDGSRRWLTIRARPLVRPGEERPHVVVASCTDVTEQHELELQLADLAQRDPLTGLWNRRRFEDDLAKQLARCRRYDDRAVLLVLGFDGFKQVNGRFGHLAGDEVLRALADGLSRRLRASDNAARIGGDEFALLLLNVEEEQAREMASEVAARLTEFVHEQLDAHIGISLSMGVVLLDREAGGAPDALAAADRAMDIDKRRPSRTSPPGDEPATSTDQSIPTWTAPPPHLSSLRVLLTAVEARDQYTAVHSRKVVTLARTVARHLGLDGWQVSEVESAALLHDLGKIAMPDAILRKRGPLTEHEQLLMRQHPVVGAQMVSSIPELEHLAPAIRAEHERWDGRGYPDGLAREAIPLASRITFVCDAYNAMTSDRPYRRALSHEAAIIEITDESGRQFCPSAAGALLAVLQADTAKRQEVEAATRGGPHALHGLT